ncbi:hypothetical protein HMI49_40275 [Corallococcus exercitus]|uniref:Calcineurin-like phosphoesterase domain-containing protein n=1 Tax=Corallococcus exercitus TaxID=2316736 RepID=A0A7Y4KUW3_9BACT|nr:metallophosphoesterase [Corallococcus exercitus]NOK39424.1 hypothetical protein [Corallococcus exercitus]
MSNRPKLLSYCAIIGDIHGEVSLLERLLRRPEVSDRSLLFLGDLLTRGLYAKQVMEVIIGLGDRAASVLGNHDQLLMQYYDNGILVPFASVGGIETIRSYVGVAHGDVHSQFKSAFPLSHLGFMRGMHSCVETQDLLISHAGLDPDDPASRTFDALTTSHPELFRREKNLSKKVICGHYAQEGGRPFLGENLYCIDTGCGTTGGPLTALLLPEWKAIAVLP